MIILYLLSLGSAVVIYVVWKLVAIIIKDYKSSLRFIPGPPNASWVFGNLNQIYDAGGESLHEAWVQKYGNVFKYKEWLNGDALYTTDTRALNHILSHSNDYQKPAVARFNLAQVVGKGILFVEGEQHRQQRRIMNPAFGPAQIRELTEIFVEKSILVHSPPNHPVDTADLPRHRQLRDVWAEEVAKHGEPARIDLINGLSKMTLDVIGLAGFNYCFDALNIDGKTNELNAAFRVVFGAATAKPSVFAMMRYLFSPLRIIPSARIRAVSTAMATMRRIGMQLIQEKKAEIAQSLRAGEKANSKLEGAQSRDLLTLLIKANMATDIPESQKLSDEDVLAQVPTFLTAGHETTSNATAWCLYALSQAPEVQRKLREELLEVSTDSPTMDELLALQYLDAVVRETLRVHAPVPMSGRVAVKDDVIPLNAPFTDVHGHVHDSIKIDKGTHVDIPILALNRSKELWGDDAFEFKPERWNAIPEATNSIPGVWGNLMTFLGGPRSCIGYRFTLVEMKALVFTLVRTFEFELAVPLEEIGRQAAAVQRPIVISEKEKGSQLPMFVKPVRRT